MTKRISPYLYLAPCLLFVGTFIYYPMIMNVGYGFFDWTPFSSEMDFVGFQNYIDLFKDSVFFISLKNNLLIVLFSLICQVFLGLIIAAALEDPLFRRFSPVFRTVYFIPVLISLAVVGLLFDFIYSPDDGLLNELLRLAGLGNLTMGWLGNSSTAIYAIIAVIQWHSVGFYVMLFVITIQKIPAELYEAAKIDGATRMQTFFYVTVPQVKEMLFFLSVLSITGGILSFGEVFVLTSGGPGNSTQLLITMLYKKAFADSQMGDASAIANIVLVITVSLFLLQKKLYRTGE